MRIRTTQRLGQIALTLIGHGFGAFVRRVRLRRYIPWSRFFRTRQAELEGLAEGELTLGKRMVATLEELGPIFVKLGQLLSSRPDILPPDLMEDLKLLQDQVTPFPTEQARKILRHEFKKDVEELFQEFSSVPIASGSIAQMYLAKTKDGEQVAVKVRRPGIEQIAKMDLYLMRWGAKNIERHIPELHRARPTVLVEEFAQTLEREMDFLNEAAITDRVHNFFKNDRHIVVPRVHWNLSSSRVLTVSFITGRNFHEALADSANELDKPRLARVLIESFMRQVLELGVFHADPHPGNFLILPPDRIGMVDFGMAGQLDRHRDTQFLFLLAAAHYRYMDLVTDLLIDMNAISPETDLELLKRDLRTLLDKWSALPLKHISLHGIFQEIAALAREHQVTLPRDFVLFGKSLAVIGGTAYLLDPTLSPTKVIAEKVREALIKLVGREYLSREAVMGLWHTGLLLKELPHNLRDLSRKLLRGQLRTQLDVIQMDNLIRELDHSSNRLSFALIIAAIIIGSSLIFHSGVGPNRYGIPLLGLTGYIIAGIMGLWLVVAIMRSGKLS